MPIDGQRVRGSHARGRGLGPLYLVRAWAQALVDDKSNASDHPGTAAQAVSDRLHCDPGLGTLRQKQDADCVVRVRAHYKGLYNRLEDTFALELAEAFAGAATVGNGHGRVEIRRCWTAGDPDREWCDLASLVWAESEHRCGDRATTDSRGFIANLPSPRPNVNHRRCASTGGYPPGAKLPTTES